MDASSERPAKYSITENVKLIEKISSEAGSLQWLRIQGEHGKVKAGFWLVGILSAMTVGSAFVPDIGFDKGSKFFLPIITLILGHILTRTERVQ